MAQVGLQYFLLLARYGATLNCFLQFGLEQVKVTGGFELLGKKWGWVLSQRDIFCRVWGDWVLPWLLILAAQLWLQYFFGSYDFEINVFGHSGLAHV